MSTTRPAAQPTVQIRNERVIVTEWRFAPGAETGWHRHGHDYVVVPMTDGKLELETPTGRVIAELKTGQSYTRGAASFPASARTAGCCISSSACRVLG